MNKNRKIYLNIPFLVIGLLVWLVACQSDEPKKVKNLAPNAHQVTAGEVIQTRNYTYVRVICDERDYWVAISKADIKEGETYFWSIGTEMNNFTSKELNRTFPSIFFVQDFTDQPITNSQPPAQQGMMSGRQPVPEKEGISVQRAAGGITIAELFSKKNSFAGQKVKIRGEVVKFSGGIMKKNWVHLQDGTKDPCGYDLTVTTQDMANLGDVVIFEGIIALDRDFGAGYFYDVIMEDARLVEK